MLKICTNLIEMILFFKYCKLKQKLSILLQRSILTPTPLVAIIKAITLVITAASVIVSFHQINRGAHINYNNNNRNNLSNL